MTSLLDTPLATKSRQNAKKKQAKHLNPDSLFGLPLAPPEPRGARFSVASQHLADEIDRVTRSFSPELARQKLTKHSERTWLKRGEKRALALFQLAAKHVPAYKKFLSQHGIKPQQIKTIEDFKKLPVINKENYLRAFPLNELCWYGELESSHIISVSSGSSGEPFFWPRGQILDAETALEHELFLTSAFDVDTKTTLLIICFAMGMYVAGPITMSSGMRMGLKGYPLTVVTPGYSPDDVLSVIPELAPQYDQIILAGYPPYLKEIVDQGIDQGIDWSKFKTRFLLAGEGFNESWRTHVAELAGGQNPLHDFINLYGSADAAVLGHETAASIIIRRRVFDDHESRLKLFGDERLPSLLQYHPEHKFFETVNNELIFTATGGIPLIRYNIHDRGGILDQKTLVEIVPALSEYFAELKAEQKLWNIPFVYVFGKSDQTVILYGANVYPENIRRALEEEGLRKHCSGKIVMYTDLDHNKDQRLYVDIECSKGTQPTKQLTEKITRRIFETLLEVNPEYRTSFRGTGEKMTPIVRLFSYGDEQFRSRKIKHTWTRQRR